MHSRTPNGVAPVDRWQESCRQPPIWGKPCTFALRYVNDREAGHGVTLMRDGIEGAGPLAPTPGPRQGSPVFASQSDDGIARKVRILSVLGGPLARAGPHPVSTPGAPTARPGAPPRGKGRPAPAAPAAEDALRMP